MIAPMLVPVLAALLAASAAPPVTPRVPALPTSLTIDVSVSPEAHAEPITGRVFAIFTHDGSRPPVQQVSPTGVPFFGVDVAALPAGESVTIGGDVFGYPLESVDALPPGHYFVQAFVNLYTRFDRADGHTVWLPMDHGEGQAWQRSPGNIYSAPQEVDLGPDGVDSLRLVCDQVIAPIAPPADTEQVRHLTVHSELLSRFWGRPVELAATVLLPRGYNEHPRARYPVDYVQGHFSRRAPGGFGSGRAFDRFWMADDTPRFLMVTFQHPTPFYDDSYAVNSANTGPYGDAIVDELIPAIEQRFRAVGAPWGRFLSGSSTGGWEALALQIFHPDVFGGAWALCPDGVDFHYHQIVNVYDDDNAYWIDHGWLATARPSERRPDGEVVFTMRDENHYELVVGDRSRSGGQWDVWQATYGPVGTDGYPQPIWDKRTGVIDHDVAAYWREHFDLRHILERDWATLGPRLVGKLHVYVGDMDSYYLNDAVGLLETFLESTTDPYYDGEVVYKRLAPHCWGPPSSELIEKMAAQVDARAPAGADRESWRY